MSSKKYRLLINLGPLKKGGGQNVALNFLQSLQRLPTISFEPFFVVCKDTMVHKVLLETKWKNRLCIVDPNPLKRIIQELSTVRSFVSANDISVVYTYFGFAPLGKNIRQVIGSADSNLYFPEVPFWKNESKLGKVRRYLVDKYRIFGLKTASGVIYENKAMYDRALPLFGIKDKALILPSIDEPTVKEDLFINSCDESIKILMLCGWQRNKNILLIPSLVNKLKSLGIKSQFVITVEQDGSDCAKEFFQLVKYYEITKEILCIGPVSKANLPSLYAQIDQVLLLSLLESFSNNIIEAWYFKKPLLISDEAWSRAICHNAAYYTPRNDVNAIASCIVKLAHDENFKDALVKEGLTQLALFPSVDEKLLQEIKFIERFVK